MSTRRALLAALVVVTAGWMGNGPTTLAAQADDAPEMIYMCYRQGSGVVYRVNPPEQPGLDPKLKDSCTGRQDVLFSWAKVVASPDGNVGIGVTEPEVALDVSGDIHASGRLIVGNNTITIDDATNSIRSTSGVISFDDENLVTTGTIESASGGFKFPDGTVQTSAGVAGSHPGATGDNSVALGNGSQASGDYATAIGAATTASGYASTALGSNTIAGEHNAMAFGWNAVASGEHSMALGNYTEAGGSYSLATGRETSASGEASTAVGSNTLASGDFSVAMGSETEAIGNYSTAMGHNATASGPNSLAKGYEATASGEGSTAMGSYTIASGDGSTAMGRSTRARGDYSTTMGHSNSANGHASTALGAATIASGDYSTATGFHTTASGDYSTAMGHSASTNGKSGAFVYADISHWIELEATSHNQFMVRAAGGTVFYSNSVLTAGVSLAPGASAWSAVSDASLKENFRDLDGETVLDELAAMPIREWNYIAQEDQVRHAGPTAQDFYAAFGLGEDPLRISTIDADGIALVAIQALEQRTRTQAERIEVLERRNQELLRRLEALEGALLELDL